MSFGSILTMAGLQPFAGVKDAAQAHRERAHPPECPAGKWPAGRGLHELMLRSSAQAAVDDAVDERIFRRAKARQS
jgi:hypothetical protein